MNRYSEITVLLLLFLASSCKSTMNLTSSLLDRDVVVNGSEDEWVDVLKPVEEQDFVIGLLNDDEYLYVSLVTSSAQLRNQIMALGLTVWIDPAGGKAKTTGIRFPMGMMEEGMPAPPEAMQRDPEMMEKFFNESLNEFEFIGVSDEETSRWVRSEVVEHLELDASSKTGTFVYELKMPLVSEKFGYAMDLSTGVVGIGLQTPQIDREMIREQMQGRGGGFGDRGGMGAGGFGGGGFGGVGPGRGGMQGGFQRGMPDPLDFWATLTLASGNE